MTNFYTFRGTFFRGLHNILESQLLSTHLSQSQCRNMLIVVSLFICRTTTTNSQMQAPKHLYTTQKLLNLTTSKF